MVKQQIKRRNSGLHMEAVTRFGNIPIVETGFKAAEDVYVRLKSSNRLFNWYFDTAEAAIFATVESFLPAIRLFEGPLRRIDKIMCKSLDIVEQRVPAVYLPPQMMYWNTKEYMSDRFVKPVMKRADSVKQLGTAVLELPITEFAAGRIDGAFTVADKYVDKYLTVDGTQDQVDGNPEPEPNDQEKVALKAIHHGQRFSRKLKRRLTARTILEARALKKQSKEAIHILIYAAELIAKDPKQAMQKARELWAYLSEDEPENQARPQTLEQLIVLLTRESARRVVHLINFTSATVARIPKIPFRGHLYFRGLRVAKQPSNNIYCSTTNSNGICKPEKQRIKRNNRIQLSINDKADKENFAQHNKEATNGSNSTLAFDIWSDKDFPDLRKSNPVKKLMPKTLPYLEAQCKRSHHEELFTEQELLKVSTELINKLAKCSSKVEQYNVVVEVAVRFLYSKKGKIC